MLFVRQPWANLISLKLKPLETRHWKKSISYRGEILICSSKEADDLSTVKEIMTPDQFNNFQNLRKKLNFDIFYPGSIACCVVNMTDYRVMNKVEDPRESWVKFDPELKVLCFQDIRPVVSFPTFPGMLGLIHAPEEYLSQIKFD